MNTNGDTKSGPGPASDDDGGRQGQSGRGARTALEHLLRQEQRRDAQLPREGDGAGDSTGTVA